MRTFGIHDIGFILLAAQWTVLLSLIAFVGGAIFGLAIALARTSENLMARQLATVYIQLFQGTPLLMQLFMVFFGAPVLGLEVSPWVAAGVALTLNTSAFLGEIWRGCIQAVPQGQWEAADALGLRFVARMRAVILPQAWKMALPPTIGYLVQVIKGTSLAAIIGFTEITRAGQIINNATFQPLIVFSVVGAVYFFLCWPLSLLAGRDLKGVRVAVARASTQDTALTAIAPQGTDIRRFDDDASAMQALLSGQVDALGCATTVAAQIAKRAGDAYENKLVLRQQFMAPAMRLGQADLLKDVNAFVGKYVDNGELNKLYMKWLGTELPQMPADSLPPVN